MGTNFSKERTACCLDCHGHEHRLAFKAGPRVAYATQFWMDRQAEKRTAYTYQVTACDRLHNESVASPPVTIKTRGRRGEVRVVHDERRTGEFLPQRR